MKEVLFQMLFPDKYKALKNVSRAYIGAHKLLKEIGRETSMNKVKERVDDYFLPQHLRSER